MQTKILTVFFINLAVIGLLYIVFVRRLALPSRAKHLLLICFVIAPVFIAVKGIESVVFASDILGIPILLAAAGRWRNHDIQAGRLKTVLLFLLLLWPLLMTGVVLMTGNDGGTQFDRRELQGLAIWFYRNAVLMGVFVLALSLRLSTAQLRELLTGFLVLSVGMVALGAVNYLNIYNLAIFEQLLSSFETWGESAYKTSSTTWGFGYLGMFRGSMGQWYANSALLALAAYIVLPGTKKLLAVFIAIASIVLVMISFSRAGLVAAAVSIFLYAVLLGFRGWRLLLLAAVCSIALLPLLEVDILQQRIQSISGYADSKEKNRVDAWYIALAHFGGNFLDTMIGVGATNRVQVYKLIGAYGAHNEYLDAMFRAGAGSLVLLFGFLVIAFTTGLSKYFQARDTNSRAMAAILPALILSNAVLGLTQDHLYRDYSSYATGPMMFFLYGILLSFDVRPSRRSSVQETAPLSVQQRQRFNFA